MTPISAFPMDLCRFILFCLGIDIDMNAIGLWFINELKLENLFDN